MKVEIYTDGGARSNGKEDSLSAWAYTMTYGEALKENYKAVIGKTNNEMELQACIEALKSIKRFNIPIILYSDSAYVVNGITQWVSGWKKRGWTKADKKPILNLEMWKELDSLNSKFEDISWVRVKGHADNEGNNRADLLVNLAMDEYLGRND